MPETTTQTTPDFSYDAAFTRNIGWLTEWEQDALRGKRIAIAGLGGVGGAHLLTLARLGIGGFNLADFDTFSLANFNRQVGANVETLDRSKLDVMATMALAINPTLRLRRFPRGVDASILDAFLDDVDLYVDGLDFFELAVRRAVFRRCADLGIPAITAAPIGMGTNWLIFAPDGMSFERYFRLENQPETEQYLRFLIGLAPAGVHRKYLVDPSRVDLKAKAGPSTGASCQLCAGVVGVEAAKLLLGRNNLRPAPVHHHFDPYAGTHRKTRLRWGVSGPWQRLKLAIARGFYLRQLASTPTATAAAPDAASPLRQILDKARWAPSGDNAQPWRFEVLDDERVVIHFRDESRANPYEYGNAEPSLLSLGMLIQTIRTAASAHGRGLAYTADTDHSGALSVLIDLPHRQDITPDPLEPFITSRSVERRALQTRKLTSKEKAALQGALGTEFTLQWSESAGERWRIARLGARVSNIRLRAPALFPIHQRVIDWSNRNSPAGLPAQSIGLDPATLRLMRWAMKSWQRMSGINKVFGTAGAALQLDLLPGLRSAGFFSIMPAVAGVRSRDATIRAGAAVQRFWLMAEKLGLALQPATAILMVAHYGATGTPFTGDAKLDAEATTVARIFNETFGIRAGEIVFAGRIGKRIPRLPGARSVRRSLSDLELRVGVPQPTPMAA